MKRDFEPERWYHVSNSALTTAFSTTTRMERATFYQQPKLPHLKENSNSRIPPLHTRKTMESSNAEATEYLTHLLNKTLRIHTSDSRIFVGTMKCTDRVCFLPSAPPSTLLPSPPLITPSLLLYLSSLFSLSDTFV
jgi:hypothetical protein